MKSPKFGKNKVRSFIEYDTEVGRLRIGSEGERIFFEINETKHWLTDASGNVTANIIGNITGNITGNVTGNVTGDVTGDLTGNVISGGVETRSLVATVAAANIVGTDAGDIGHANGAELVPAPGAGYVLELVSAILIYDFDTAAYTGGGDDNVIQNGDGAVALTTPVAGADLLEAAGDKIVQLIPLSASDQALVENKPLTLKGTALTQPGLPEVCTIQVTVAEDTGGNCQVTLNGVTHDIPVTNDTINNNAIEIQQFIDALPGYSASVLTDTVTVTAAATGTQTDATFAQGTANSIAATVTVTQQGVDSAAGVLRAHVTYRIHTTNL
jgi:hypothetical protein